MLQADKLVFIASQAAVRRRGNEYDLYEQDVAALVEAQQFEDEQALAAPELEAEAELSDQDYDEMHQAHCD